MWLIFSLVCCIQVHIIEQLHVSEDGYSWERTRRHAASAARGKALGARGGRKEGWTIPPALPSSCSKWPSPETQIYVFPPEPITDHFPYRLGPRFLLTLPPTCRSLGANTKELNGRGPAPRDARANCRDYSIRVDKENAEPL